jgi:hypothetical protein
MVSIGYMLDAYKSRYSGKVRVGENCIDVSEAFASTKFNVIRNRSEGERVFAIPIYGGKGMFDKFKLKPDWKFERSGGLHIKNGPKQIVGRLVCTPDHPFMSSDEQYNPKEREILDVKRSESIAVFDAYLRIDKDVDGYAMFVCKPEEVSEAARIFRGRLNGILEQGSAWTPYFGAEVRTNLRAILDADSPENGAISDSALKLCYEELKAVMARSLVDLKEHAHVKIIDDLQLLYVQKAWYDEMLPVMISRASEPIRATVDDAFSRMAKSPKGFVPPKELKERIDAMFGDFENFQASLPKKGILDFSLGRVEQRELDAFKALFADRVLALTNEVKSLLEESEAFQKKLFGFFDEAGEIDTKLDYKQLKAALETAHELATEARRLGFWDVAIAKREGPEIAEHAKNILEEGTKGLSAIQESLKALEAGDLERFWELGREMEARSNAMTLIHLKANPPTSGEMLSMIEQAINAKIDAIREFTIDIMERSGSVVKENGEATKRHFDGKKWDELYEQDKKFAAEMSSFVDELKQSGISNCPQLEQIGEMMLVLKGKAEREMTVLKDEGLVDKAR